MLAANHPSEDHIHEPVKALDPDRLPPRPDSLLPRIFTERCRCGAIQTVDEAGIPASPWFLTSLSALLNGDEGPGPQDR